MLRVLTGIRRLPVRFFAALFLLLSATTVFAAPAPLEIVTLSLNFKHQFEFAGYYAAKEQGFYKKLGLDVKILELQPGTDPVQEVVKGRADYGISLSDLVLEAIQGQPIVLLANFFKHSPVFILARSEIKNVSDLAGKTIMGTPGDLKIAELAYLFHEGKVNTTTIKWIPNSNEASDLIKGRADAMVAYSTNQPFKIKGKHERYTILSPADSGADFFGDSLFTSKDEIELNPGRAERFSLASRQGWDYALEHSEEIIRLIRKEYAPERSVEELSFEAGEIRKLMLPATYEIGSIDRSRLHRIADIFVELGMADPDYDLSSFVLKSPGKNTQELQVRLNRSEAAFLLENPVATIAFMDDFSPFSFVTKQGHQGFAKDYYELLAKKTGLKFLPSFGSWSTNLDMFKRNEVDLIDGISFDSSRKDFTLFTSPYYTIPLVLFARTDFGFYLNLSQLFGKRVGIVRDVYFRETLARYPKIDLMELPDSETMMRGLSVGLVDAVITNMGDGTNTIRELGLDNVRYAGDIDLEGKHEEDLRIGIRPDMPELFSIIKKGMAAMSLSELAALRDKWLLQSPKDRGPMINLTDSEKDFLVNHPVIRVGNEENWPPFDLNVAGQAQGFGVDLLKLVADRTGIGLEFVSDFTWDETMAMFYDKKIDVLHSLSRNQEREEHALFTKPFYHSPHVLVCSKKAMNITTIEDLYGKTLAMPEKWAVADYLKQHHPQIKLLYVKDTMEALSEVAQGRAFGTIEQEAVLQYFIKRYGFTTLRQVLRFDEFDSLGNSSMYIAVRDDWPLLRDLVDKALKTVSPGEITALEMKWFGQVAQLNQMSRQEVKVFNLSKSEAAFLENLNRIRFSIYPDRMPFEGDEGREIEGMVVDFIALFERKLGIPFVHVPILSGENLLGKLKSGDCDILPMAAVSHLKADSVSFTAPYLSFSVGIIVEEEFPFISGVNDLVGKDVGVVAAGDLWDRVTSQYPLVDFRQVESVTQGLINVSSGKLSALIVDLPVAYHYIGKLGLTNLKVAGLLERLKEIGIATRKDSVELSTIMMKLVSSLTREEVDAIYRKWVTLRFEHRFDYRSLWKYMLAAAALLLGVVFWNRKLSHFNRQITEANAKLQQISATDRLTGLYNRMKLDERLLVELQRVVRYKHPLSLIMMDIDLFKSVNDTFGHLAGDAVLVLMSATIKENIRSTDICGRWGGEEFMVICPETDLNGASLLAENLRKTIASTNFPALKTQTGSFGVTQYREGDAEVDLIARADKAMYMAKERGRNRVETLS